MWKYGLKVLDITEPSSIRLAEEIRLNLVDAAFKISGDSLFAVSLENGIYHLLTYDLANPLSPKRRSRLPLRIPGSPVKFSFVGEDLVTVSLPVGREQLQIFKFGKEISEIGRLDLSSVVRKPSGWNNWNVQTVGNRVYFYGDGLEPSVVVIDVTNPKTPRTLWASPLDTGGRMMDARVVGDYLYANWYYPGIQVYDFSDPMHPFKLAREPYGWASEFSTDAWSMGVVSGPYLYSPKLSFASVFRVPRSSQRPLGKVTFRILE